jgi:uroporphyrinogen-III synthase
MVEARKPSALKVLLTRPVDQGQHLCRLIEALGCIAYHCPMLEIVAVEPRMPVGWQKYDWWIFTSANAVRFALQAGLPRAGGVKLAAIGKATAQALEAAGFKVDLQAPPPYASESLLAQEPLLQVAGQSVLIVKGVGGRTELAERLRQRGAEVETLELYRRDGPSAATVARLRSLLDQGLDAVLVSSGEGLTNLQQAVGGVPSLYAVPMIVGSARLKELACQRGFTEVIEAASPLDEAMVEALAARFGLR